MSSPHVPVIVFLLRTIVTASGFGLILSALTRAEVVDFRDAAKAPPSRAQSRPRRQRHLVCSVDIDHGATATAKMLATLLRVAGRHLSGHRESQPFGKPALREASPSGSQPVARRESPSRCLPGDGAKPGLSHAVQRQRQSAQRPTTWRAVLRHLPPRIEDPLVRWSARCRCGACLAKDQPQSPWLTRSAASHRDQLGDAGVRRHGEARRRHAVRRHAATATRMATRKCSRSCATATRHQSRCTCRNSGTSEPPAAGRPRSTLPRTEICCKRRHVDESCEDCCERISVLLSQFIITVFRVYRKNQHFSKLNS
jgi:hypothetical protein